MCSYPIPVVAISEYRFICHYRFRQVIRPTSRYCLLFNAVKKPSFCSSTNCKKYFHMSSFLCDPVKLFYTFEKMPLRRGPDSSPDSQGLQGTTKGRKTPSSAPHAMSTWRISGLLRVPLQGPVQEPDPTAGLHRRFQVAPRRGPVSSQGWLRVLGLCCFAASPHHQR